MNLGLRETYCVASTATHHGEEQPARETEMEQHRGSRKVKEHSVLEESEEEDETLV